MALDLERGAPYQRVPAKRSFDNVPVAFDWHDYLANLWKRGTFFALAQRIRPQRAMSVGYELEVTTPGTSGQSPPRWAKGATPGTVFTGDGSVVWTVRALSNASMRATISVSAWPTVAPLTITNQALADFLAGAFVAGGLSGQTYEVRNRVTLSNGETKEGVAVLPIED